MPLPLPSAPIVPAANRFQKTDRWLLGLSIAIQLIFAVLFGHVYDIRIFTATGYLVGTGQNPYISQDLSAIFHNPSYQNITSIGYPPPWPLLLGLIYRAVYAWFPNFLVYNFAIKLPVLIANIALAYLVAGAIRRLNGDALIARKAWIFMLLNPFLLYASVAWGQIDSIIAFLALSSLILLDSGKIKFSAVLLALAISFKPTALPLALIPFFYLNLRSIRQVLMVYGIFIFSGFLFCVVPFIIDRWDPAPILQNWNAHFTVGGGMSFMVFLELLQNSYQLRETWWLEGLFWMPALAITAFWLRRGIAGFKDLLMKSTALIMVFFLTRAWVSEPNILLVLPFILILASMNELDRRLLFAIWILPFIFSFFNTAAAQLFFPSMPSVMDKLLILAEDYRTVRLVAKVIVVIPWQIAGWWVVYCCLRRAPASCAAVTLETEP